MSAIQPSVLSIAGFDPSGGAGVLADIKTAESSGISAFGVVTCLTYQNQNSIEDVKWESQNSILKQLAVLKQAHEVQAVKVGVVKNVSMLSNILKSVLEYWPSAKIVWDPVVRSTSGYQFFHFKNLTELIPALVDIDVMTPNLDEAELLFGQEDLSKMKCAVLLTGIQTENGDSEDRLFADGRCTIFKTKSHDYKKHGSGCVLSTGIACGLARGLVLTESIEEGTLKTQGYLKSNADLLGKHTWT